MDVLNGMLEGLKVAFSLQGIIFLIIGVSVGTMIGMIPGLGPITAIAVMIPITYGMNPAVALLLMAGVYYGAAYGGGVSSILLNAPGVSESVATSFDGYPMAKQGMAGKALAIHTIASFIGGTLTVVYLTFMAPVLAKVAVSFGPPEYFALMVMGLTAIASLSDGSTLRALIAATIGFMISTIGIDGQTGTQRFTFGNVNLLEGIDFLVVALGLFALAEVCSLILNRNGNFDSMNKLGSFKLTKTELKEVTTTSVRQSVLGFVVGVLPGAGGTISSFLAYMTEKKLSKNPDEFGKGSVRGVAAPEAANNSANNGAFVPLLSLGIPGSGTTAVMLGALLVLGIQPGPLLMSDHPDVFWGVIMSMYAGNIILLIINLPFIPYIVKILRIPRPLLISLVIVFSLMGVYAISFNTFDLYLLLGFGILGYLMRLAKFPAAPLLLAFILGDMIEQSFRQSLTISNGSVSIFFTSPIAAGLLFIALLSFLVPIIKNVRKKKVSNTSIDL